MVSKKRALVKDIEVEESSAEANAGTTQGSPQLEVTRAGVSVAELYGNLQTAVAEDPAKVNEYVKELLQLLAEAESPETPLLVRVRILEFISRHGQHLRDGNALKKIVTSFVKILSGPEDSPQLLVAAVQGISSLGPVSVMDKKWEYLSREGADVLMQVMLDEEGFSEQVRQAATKALNSLIHTAFRPVATKLLHWISDDREAEEETQMLKERRMAMSWLRKLAHTPSLRSQWTAEVQEHVLGLIIRVLSTVTVREFVQLTAIAAGLPMVRESGGIQLLTAFLARNQLNTDRALESLSIIEQHVSSTPHDISPAFVEAGLLAEPVETNTPRGMWHAKALLLLARLATPENADSVYVAVLQQLEHVMGDGSALPGNLTTLESVLFALIEIGKKRPSDLLKVLNDDVFAEKFKRLNAAINNLEPLLLYALKKAVQRGSAGPREAEALACCQNVRVILNAFASRHIPMGAITTSWTQKNKLPALKRGRETTTLTAAERRTKAKTDPGVLGVLPSHPGTEEYEKNKIKNGARFQKSVGGSSIFQRAPRGRYY